MMLSLRSISDGDPWVNSSVVYRRLVLQPGSGRHIVCDEADLRAQAGEGRLVAGVEGLGAIAAATSTAEVSTVSMSTISTSTTATALTTSTAALATAFAATLATSLTTAATRGAAGASTSTTATGALRLDVALVNVDDLLGLALALTLGLGSGGGDEVLILVLGQSLGVSPLLVNLGSLVGLADLEALSNGELLLGLLGEVVGVRDALVLLLGHLLSVLSILGNSLLQFRLGDLLACLLILLLSTSLSGAPGLGSLLVRAGTRGKSELCYKLRTFKMEIETYVTTFLVWRSS